MGPWAEAGPATAIPSPVARTCRRFLTMSERFLVTRDLFLVMRDLILA